VNALVWDAILCGMNVLCLLPRVLWRVLRALLVSFDALCPL